MASKVTDNLNTGATPVEVGRVEIQRPFRSTGDNASLIVKRRYKQSGTGYTPATLGTADATYSTSYLVQEDDPANTQNALWEFGRIYASVPADVVIYSSRVITKPSGASLSAVGPKVLGSYLSTEVGATIGTAASAIGAVWTNTNEVYSEKTLTNISAFPSGGTFTITYKTSTTAALAYNAADATINAAVNALADIVSDGITVSCGNFLSSGGYVAVTATAGAFASRVTMNAAGLSPAAAQTGLTKIQSTALHFLYSAARFTVTAHGFNASNSLMCYGSTLVYNLFAATTGWVSVDANTIAVCPLDGLYPKSTAGQKIRDYTPGTDRIGTRETRSFYLPGVTLGIASPTDIAIPATLLNDTDFLTEIKNGTTGYKTYDSSELSRWNDWPIYNQTKTEINMNDA